MKKKNPKRVKAGRRSKAKGGAFERKIAKDLTEWSGIDCRRTPRSGAFYKTGDVWPIDPDQMKRFPFNLECKNQKVLTPGVLFNFGKTKPVQRWWKQCRTEAKPNKKIPILVFTNNGLPEFVMFKEYHSNKIMLRFSDHFKFVMVHKKQVVLLWEDLITIPYNELVKVLKSKVKS